MDAADAEVERAPEPYYHRASLFRVVDPARALKDTNTNPNPNPNPDPNPDPNPNPNPDWIQPDE